MKLKLAYIAGIITALAAVTAVVLSLEKAGGERGSGRKSQPEQHSILLAEVRGETQPSEPKGDRSPDPGKGRRD